MMLPASSDPGVFVDWLDFTLPPDISLLPSFRQLLERSGLSGQQSGTQWVYSVSDHSGVCRLGPNRGVDRVSLSGGILAYLRLDRVGWCSLLDWLAGHPHRITRLDATLDVHEDAVPVLRRFRQRVGRSGGRLALGQRPSPVTWVLGRNSDGLETGTMYVGVRGKSQFLARVYDKRHELLSRGQPCAGPVIRYEIEAHGSTGKSRNPCLNDVHDPTSLFWEFAAPSLLKRPPGVPQWRPEQFQTFSVPRPESDPLDRLMRYIELTGFFAGLVAVADGLDNRNVQLERIVQFEVRKALRLADARELHSAGASVPADSSACAASRVQ